MVTHEFITNVTLLLLQIYSRYCSNNKLSTMAGFRVMLKILQFTSVETSYILHKTNFMYAQKTAADGNQATAGVEEEIDS